MKYYAINSNIYNEYKYFFKNIYVKKIGTFIHKEDVIVGWGRKKSGIKAEKIAIEKKCNKILCEDGFYRSVKSGFEGHLSLSLIKDNVGIYYDATTPSQLENYLNEDDTFKKFNINKMKSHINYIKEKKLSKYNFNIPVPSNIIDKNKKNILFVSQIKDDKSLEFGFGDEFDSISIIIDILKYYPNDKYNYYLKIHPEVLSKIKDNDINIDIFKNYGFDILEENYNPIDLISYFDVICTKTSQMGFEALLMGKEVVCYGAPFYSGWGLTKDRVEISRRVKKRTIYELFYASVILYSEYRNPNNGELLLFEEALQLLDYYRNIFKMDEKKPHLYGFSLWKRTYVSYFIKNENILFHNHRPSKKNVKNNNIYVWGMKRIGNIPQDVNVKNIIRVEDGFIRSVSLGSDFTMPYSLIFDKTGIYFNAEGPSDLENILNNDINFNDSLRGKGEKLINILNTTGISKYNNNSFKSLKFDTDKHKILVVGQVEDDDSIKFNLNKNINNLKLLKTVRKENHNSFIVYKPHPDVINGNRNSSLTIEEAKKFADKIVTDYHIHDVIKSVDEVHVITSLSGLEALIRNKKVVCHGTPFYSGWGLTEDRYPINRRKAKRTLEELVAASYILYPRYIDPISKKYTDVFFIIDYIKKSLSNKEIVSSYNLFFRVKNYIITFFKSRIR